MSPDFTVYVSFSLTGAGASTSSAFTVNTSPGWIRSLLSLFSSLSCVTDVPTSLAIPHNVSPPLTLYSSADTAVAATPVSAVNVATDTTVFFIKCVSSY